jgi:hypothetical protein
MKEISGEKKKKVIVKRFISNDLLPGPSTHTLPSNVNNNGIKVDSKEFKASTTIAPSATFEEVIEGTPKCHVTLVQFMEFSCKAINYDYKNEGFTRLNITK